MAKYNHIINSFSAGELSQKLRARVNIEEYDMGLEKMENFLPIPSGGAALRPGTRHIRTSFLSEATTVFNPESLLIPFIFSKEEAYIVSFQNDFLIEIFTREGRSVSVTALTSTYALVPLASTGLARNEYHYTQSGDILYVTHSSGRVPPIVIKRTAENTFTYANFFYSDNPITEIGYSRDIITKMPFRLANIETNKQVRYETTTSGSAGVLRPPAAVVVHQNTAHTQWYPGDVVRLSDNTAGIESVFMVTSQVSGTVYNALCLVGFDAALSAAFPAAGTDTTLNNWNMAVFRPMSSATGLDGVYPKTVALYHERLIFGGCPDFLDTLFCSAVGRYAQFITDRLDQDLGTTDFSRMRLFDELTDKDAFRVEPTSNEVNEVRWLSSQTNLVVGTSGAETIVASVDGEFSAEKHVILPKAVSGSRAVQAVRTPLGTLSISRDGQTINLFVYNEVNGQAGNNPITYLSSEIVHYNPGLEGTTDRVKGVAIKQMAWQASRNTVWLVTDRNVLLSVTMTAGNKYAFAKHYLGGELDSTGKAEVFSICCIPNIGNTYEDLYALVRRSVNSTGGIETLEKIGDDFEHDSYLNTSDYEYDHPVYLDQALRFTAAQASTALSFVQSATTVYTADDKLFPGVKHNYHLGQVVRVSSTAALPTGLAVSTDYYVIPILVTGLKLATSLANAQAGTAINITAVGSGTMTITPTAVASLTTWSGLDIYGGKTVSVFEDGVQVADYAVPENLNSYETELSYTATAACSEVVFGFPYFGTLKSMVLEAGGANGVSRGNISRVDQLTIPLFKSYSGKYGSDEASLLPMPLNGETPETTDITVKFPQSPTRLPQIVIKSDKPKPLTVLGFIARGVAYDG